ncbi:alkaline phosphatase [Parasediminibacterium paludis]|uniref:Alkaline phosphatase n=1 Tax=Parasediminibacterium paludis TaxID=908966 RepID=A0ABV8PVD8_9BACT
MKALFLLVTLTFTTKLLIAQPTHYTVANAHSHNDYVNPQPFTTAYQAQFGSMEADIFLWNDSLIVGHTLNDIKYKRTLEQLYLNPLAKQVTANKGYPYKDTSRHLQLLIDIKTQAVNTLQSLIQHLAKYPQLIASSHIHIVITGNRPEANAFVQYPSFIMFDGNIGSDYSEAALSKIALLSDDLTNYTKWKGNEPIPAKDKMVVDALVTKVHNLHKNIRFWASPDTEIAWQQLMQMHVDYINTDKIELLAAYLNKQ